MLIIHPTDDSTDFLRVLYEGRDGIRCLCGDESRKQLNRILFHLAPGEPIMMLGHGTDAGLFRLEEGAYRCYIGRSMAYSIRKHPIIGIWCHANLFAEQFGLHGLFSGMIISDLQEAREYGVPATEEELHQENRLLAATLAGLLKAAVPYPEIPARMREAVGDGPAVRRFNYTSFYAL